MPNHQATVFPMTAVFIAIYIMLHGLLHVGVYCNKTTFQKIGQNQQKNEEKQNILYTFIL